jgi:hypothetical protein
MKRPEFRWETAADRDVASLSLFKQMRQMCRTMEAERAVARAQVIQALTSVNRPLSYLEIVSAANPASTIGLHGAIKELIAERVVYEAGYDLYEIPVLDRLARL